MKISSVEDLKKIREKASILLRPREEADHLDTSVSCGLDKGTPHMQILTCGGTGCKASQSHKIAENFKK
ncbi:MAG: NADH-quinone oxidoreductase subunit J/K, partial [Bacteroidales bacterium]|nr:NADH-quinone oxidoreductase subunit J/K [Bacteroidales bacterium]